MKSSNKRLLFEFDSLIDLHLGVVKALQEDYPPGESSSSKTINFSFLHQSLDKLKQFRVYGYGKNIVQECFLGTARNSYETIYKSYLEDERVYRLAPVTVIPRLIRVFSVTGFITCDIITHNELEYKTAMQIFPVKNRSKAINIIRGSSSDLNINNYSRIHMGDIRDLDNYNDFDCTYIAILNYGSNLQLITHDVILLREYIVRFGDTNQFQLIDSYTDVECPEYGKI